MSDPYFSRMLLSYQMKTANNLDLRYIVALRNNSDFDILKDETDPAVYIIGVTGTTIPEDWNESVKQATNKQSFFYKVGTSNTKPYPTWHDHKRGSDGPTMEKSSLYGRMQKYCYATGESEHKLLQEYVGMGDTIFVIVSCIKEFTEENRGQLAHKFEQEVLGTIKDNFGHPVGNIKEGPIKSHVIENSFSNIRRLEILEERKNGVGTLEQFFQ